jgi:hypothetical protein
MQRAASLLPMHTPVAPVFPGSGGRALPGAT